jgi:predicted Zn-dependent peptidase
MGFLLPAMTQDKLDNQRDVVKNERRWRVDNQPYGDWDERLQMMMYPEDHPYHHSVIGSMEDLDEASLEDVEQFFRTYYAPNNAVLSLVGDFEPARAKELIERYFGSIPRGPSIPAIPGRTELPPRWAARSVLRWSRTSRCRASTRRTGSRRTARASTTQAWSRRTCWVTAARRCCTAR